MRTAKFRGLDALCDNVWRYGNLQINQDNSMSINNGAKGYGYGTIDSKIINATVGQFTGLCDKNGKEIYEGDILFVICRFDSAKMVVSFEKGVFVLKTDDAIGYKHLGDMNNVEVIGNIHESEED